MKIEVVQTPQSGELIQTLKVMGVDPKTLKSLPNPKSVMFSVKLENIKTGDIIHVSSYGQVSNKNIFSTDKYGKISSACMFCYQTVLANSPTDNVGLAELSEARGTNITYEIHHQPWIDCPQYVFAKDYPVIYINTLVYSASQSALPKTQLVVDKDYGQSSVTLFRMSP